MLCKCYIICMMLLQIYIHNTKSFFCGNFNKITVSTFTCPKGLVQWFGVAFWFLSTHIRILLLEEGERKEKIKF